MNLEINDNSNISFIIPAFNSASTIIKTVESIFDDNFNDGDEVIIVDDASQDNTVETINKLQKKYKNIILLKHKINKGTAAAGRNTAIEISINSILFCLDADNILVPNSISKLKKYMISNKADAAAFGEIHFFLENITNVTHKWVFKSKIEFEDALAGPIFPGPSGNYMFTKESWLKAGRYFEPSLVNQTLDSWTFGIRQLGTNQKFVTLKDTYYLHLYGIESHFVREIGKGNRSLAALCGIMPFLDLIDDRDINYIMNKRGRYKWVDNMQKRPIRLKSGKKGEDGQIIYFTIQPPETSYFKKLNFKIGSIYKKYSSQ